MTAVLIIFGALAAIILLVLLLDISIILKLSDEPSVTVRILFFNFDVITLAERLSSQQQEEKADSPEASQKKKVRLTPERIIYLVKKFNELVKAIVHEFCKYVRLKICHITVRVSSDDAAETARTYGIVSGLVWGLLEFLSHHMTVKRCDKKVNIYPDFTSTESQLDMKLVLKIKTIHLLSAAMHLLPIFTKRKAG
jgi:hypothetical protein